MDSPLRSHSPSQSDTIATEPLSRRLPTLPKLTRSMTPRHHILWQNSQTLTALVRSLIRFISMAYCTPHPLEPIRLQTLQESFNCILRQLPIKAFPP